jgi:NAD+ kinase
MSNPFNTIGLIGRQRRADITDTLLSLKNFLCAKNIPLVIETETAACLSTDEFPIYTRDQMGHYCDLIIVVGGDGALLNAAHAAVNHHTPVLGINRGRLGFLTDIHPRELIVKVGAVLEGHYTEEQRFLLNIAIEHEDKTSAPHTALNDAVLMPGNIAHMIEFTTSIDKQFMSSQHADGLIVATPTGSTAYALSGGGPILHPALDAIVLVPMFPHTLSARPIVIAGNSVISITITGNNETSPRLSCDGQTHILIPPGATIHISKKPEQLRLIHPRDYNYFETLREKLHWRG